MARPSHPPRLDYSNYRILLIPIIIIIIITRMVQHKGQWRDIVSKIIKYPVPLNGVFLDALYTVIRGKVIPVTGCKGT
jgi:hypothetical protein